MEQEYFSLTIAVNRIGDKKYLSRVDFDRSSSVPASSGEFTFDPDAPAPGAIKLSEFLKKLPSGAFASQKEIETFGKCLFDCLLGAQNCGAYQTAVALARQAGRRLRICLDIAPELLKVPWEYIHDGQSFVIKKGPAIVRLLDGSDNVISSFAPLQRLLIAVANPQADPETYPPFDAAQHLDKLTKSLNQIGGLEVKQLEHATKDRISDEFRNERYDAFYFLGHGAYFANAGGHIVCEANDGAPDPLAADDLAGWIRESSTLRFVYLNSCSTANTAVDNPIQGVAQRLMRDGNVAAVAAMQVDVGQAPAMNIAQGFFEGLAKGSSPEDAMRASRLDAKDSHTFGIPVLYTTQDAPLQFETNRLKTFFSIRDDSSCAFVLPMFILGLQGKAGEDANRAGLATDKTYYRGPTYAVADVNATMHMSGLLRRVLPADRLDTVPYRRARELGKTHWFVFGSQSNPVLRGILAEYSPTYEFEYTPAQWTIKDRKAGNSYTIVNPTTQDSEAYDDSTDYGVIQKIEAPAQGRVYFLIAGLGSRATEGCARYLAQNWQNLLTEFGQKEFGIVLKFPPYNDGIRVSGPSPGPAAA